MPPTLFEQEKAVLTAKLLKQSSDDDLVTMRDHWSKLLTTTLINNSQQRFSPENLAENMIPRNVRIAPIGNITHVSIGAVNWAVSAAMGGLVWASTRNKNNIKSILLGIGAFLSTQTVLSVKDMIKYIEQYKHSDKVSQLTEAQENVGFIENEMSRRANGTLSKTYSR